MESVILTQKNDGVQSGPALVVPGEGTALEILNRKAQSHISDGWSVLWTLVNVSFTATKNKPRASKDGETEAVERLFEISVF